MISRYQNIKIINNSGKRIYNQIYFPEISDSEQDVYIITGESDRLDLIAYDFWGDYNLWWVLIIVNPILDSSSIYPESGMQLKIPQNVNQILNKYNDINNYE